MKLVAWNINGIRAVLGKGFAESFSLLNPDIISLDEIKLSEGISFPFIPEGYHTFYTISKVKKGYSGVAVFSKLEPINVSYGLENGEYDEEGRIISLEYSNFFYVAVYSPNSQETLARLPFRVEYENKLKNYLINLDKIKPVILGGDLNVAHQPIDLKNDKANEGCSGYTKEERDCFSALLNSGFIDSFRYKNPDKEEYSWWSYRFKARERNAGWRIDYFVVSEKIKDKIQEAYIRQDILGSDHCPVVLEINL